MFSFMFILIFTQDILEFVDVCHETFVGNLWLVISSYKEMFLRNSDEAGRWVILKCACLGFLCFSPIRIIYLIQSSSQYHFLCIFLSWSLSFQLSVTIACHPYNLLPFQFSHPIFFAVSDKLLLWVLHVVLFSFFASPPLILLLFLLHLLFSPVFIIFRWICVWVNVVYSILSCTKLSGL